MATKFSTWTKGERKHAIGWLRSNDILSTPGRYSPTKTDRKERNSNQQSPLSTMSACTTDTHDAAVRPGTSKAKEHLSTLEVPSHRPRSHTAPSSPCFDPIPIAELPGSTPVAQISHRSTWQHTVKSAVIPSTATFEDSAHKSSTSASTSRTPSMEVEQNSLSNTRPVCHTAQSNTSDGPPPASLSTHTAQYNAPWARSIAQTSTAEGQSLTVKTSLSPLSLPQQDDVETMLLQQITSLRASHESHLTSLKDAHDKELSTHLSYIAFLERRTTDPRSGQKANAVTASSNDPPLPWSTTDASPSAAPVYELPASDVSSIAQLPSARASQDQHTGTQDSAKEIEALKRQLSLARRLQVESSTKAQQHDQLHNALEQRNRRVLQLKALVKRAKGNEKIMQNTIDGLQAQLVSSNNQRLDALEGLHEALQNVERHATQQRRLEALTPSQNSSTPSQVISPTTFKSSHSPMTHVHTPSSSSAGSSDSTSRVTSLESEIQTLRAALKAKDNIIADLREGQRARQSGEAHNTARFFELQARLDKQHTILKAAEADRDKYDALLQSELRHRARQSVARANRYSASIEMQASNRMKGILADAQFTAGSNTSAQDENIGLVELLEKQLEHCLKETITHKLEIRSLKKDLKTARSETQMLQSITTPRPPTPELDLDRDRRSSNKSTPDRRARTRSRSTVSSQGGLGISMARSPRTPSRSAAASPAIVEDDRLTTGSGTPLSTYKKLPLPPSSTDPNIATPKTPIVTVARAETYRSLSDSIISAYAHCPTPEQQSIDNGGRPMSRSSDSSQSAIAQNA